MEKRRQVRDGRPLLEKAADCNNNGQLPEPAGLYTPEWARNITCSASCVHTNSGGTCYMLTSGSLGTSNSAPSPASAE